MVCCGAAGHEVSLLGMVATSDGWQSTREHDPGEELVWDGEECDASMDVTDQPVTLAFPDGQDDPWSNL